jgi:hypothetical protein
MGFAMKSTDSTDCRCGLGIFLAETPPSAASKSLFRPLFYTLRFLSELCQRTTSPRQFSSSLRSDKAGYDAFVLFVEEICTANPLESKIVENGSGFEAVTQMMMSLNWRARWSFCLNAGIGTEVDKHGIKATIKTLY